MEAFEPRLAPRLPASPHPEQLREKGRLYEDLAKQLGALPLADDTARKHRDTLIRQLRTLGARLDAVAKTVEDAENERSEREAAQARAERRRQAREKKRRRDIEGRQPEADHTKVKQAAPAAARTTAVIAPTAATRSAYEKSKVSIEAESQRITGTLAELARACD